MSTKNLTKQHSNGKNSINGNGAPGKARKKITTSIILARKGGKKITSVTAYDYPTAKLVDGAGVDVILVGDSLGMVVLGYPDTTKVTLDDMVHHTRAVSRAKPKALLVADMPFLTFGVSARDTILNAGRLIQGGCAEAVKLEGGVRVKDEIRAVVEGQIPVMGHVGLTPQSVHKRSAASRCRGKPMRGRIKCCATRWPCRRAVRSPSCSKAYRRPWGRA